MRGILKGWMYVPRGEVGDLDELFRSLTHQPKYYRGKPKPDPVLMYCENTDRYQRMWIGVPQAYARRAWPDMEFEDCTSEGEPLESVRRLPNPNHESVEDPVAQARFMSDFDEAAMDHNTFIVEAPTGSGKTVVALRAAAVVGRKTLIMVHTDTLARQWAGAIEEHLGVPRERIGRVGDGQSEWQDRDFVIATMQTLMHDPEKYPEEFYRAFGTVIFDEVHKVGAPVFSRVVWQFPARYRWGLSATWRRKDGGEKLVIYHLGPVRVRSHQRALPVTIVPRWYDCGSYNLWGSDHGARMKCLSLDPIRNRLITKLAVRMYGAGRHVLVVTESVAHVQRLVAMIVGAGVPADTVGQFTRNVKVVEDVRVGDRIQQVAKERRQPASVLDAIKRDCRVIVATYGMMKEGVDIPRLDGGVDATPRSDATQLVGRIRRPHEGKRDALWVTLVDSRCDRSLRYYASRLEEYRSAGMEVRDGVG